MSSETLRGNVIRNFARHRCDETLRALTFLFLSSLASLKKFNLRLDKTLRRGGIKKWPPPLREDTFVSLRTMKRLWRTLRRGGVKKWHPSFANFVYGASKIAVLRLYLCEGGITENEPPPSQSFGTYYRFLPQTFVCQKLCERKNFGPVICQPIWQKLCHFFKVSTPFAAVDSNVFLFWMRMEWIFRNPVKLCAWQRNHGNESELTL